MRYFLVSISLLIAFVAVAQIDREYFDQVFEEELGVSKFKERKNHSAAYVHTLAQEVPDWFITPPVSEGNEVFAIGISDPETDSTLAMKVALTRAQVLANILYNGTTQLLCDFFLNEVDNTTDVVFEHFSRVNTKVPNGGNFEIVNTFRNAFDETLVLIKYIPQKGLITTEHKKVKFELYKNEIETGGLSEYQSVYEMLVHSATNKSDTLGFYQLTEFGKLYDVVGLATGKLLQVPIYSLKYSGIPDSDSTQIQYFTHGLWKEYFKSLMLQIIGIARLKPENIQNLDESYQRNNLEKLTRGISVNRMRFVVTKVTAANKELKVHLTELPYPGK